MHPRRFLHETRGASVFEYAVLVGIIALVAISGAAIFGNDLSILYNSDGMEAAKVTSTAATH
ncbi:MAG: hypothetical protein WBX25_02250 [Rhodomicrobium sp.]